ncbi:pupal cuticle protein Edg-78E-like [Thrips palmi]|uniref:Pupal cuticle protein Edg-78E-like n=1 Tax=Thrips palmi TaxID=161013 RepID=A0A6P8Z3U4_THRPL|nr:pupal cuticle protein Edg-78E-like [Thrips palmi]
MYTTVLLVATALLGGALAQQQYSRDPQTAAILTDARYLSGDGTFGAAYTQEDGVQFKEETDANGDRRGAYSYVDPSGVRRTVSYTAGKNGFQASGDHLPQPPVPVAAPAPAAPQYQPQPQYNPAPAAPQYNPAPQGGSYDETGEYDPRYNDPAFQPNTGYRPQPQQYQPPPQQYQPQPQQYQPPVNAIPQYNPTTPPPHRFFPPGKLDLNRTPDGFSYSFSKSR